MPEQLEFSHRVHVPVCMCIDVSGSMSTKMTQVNSSAQKFVELLKNHSDNNNIEVAIIAFGGVNKDTQKLIQESKELISDHEIKLREVTPLGEAVIKAVSLLQARRDSYIQLGINFLPPILLLITDGKDNSDSNTLQRAQTLVKDLTSQGSLKFIPVSVGSSNEINRDNIQKFSPSAKLFSPENIESSIINLFNKE